MRYDVPEGYSEQEWDAIIDAKIKKMRVDNWNAMHAHMRFYRDDGLWEDVYGNIYESHGDEELRNGQEG